MNSKSTFEADIIRQLAKLLDETNLNEIEYEANNRRFRIARYATETQIVDAPKKNKPRLVDSKVSGANTTPIELSQGPEDLSTHQGAVKSPMVGTAFLAPEPDTPPFVKVGDQISEGQTLLIIEAMKVMNPIKASRPGTIAKVLVKDGAPVEFDEVRFIIE